MYTDGLIERRGQNIDEGIDLLGRVIATERRVRRPDRIVRNVSAAIGAPDDDVALLVTTMDGARTTFEVEIPAEPVALPELRRRLRAWLQRRELRRRREAADVVLAVSEACNNAIEHAYRRSRRHDRAAVIRDGRGDRARRDRGSGTVARDRPRTTSEGAGITLMRHLMDSAEIETEAAGTRVTLVLQLAAERESGRRVMRSRAREIGAASSGSVACATVVQTAAAILTDTLFELQPSQAAETLIVDGHRRGRHGDRAGAGSGDRRRSCTRSVRASSST